MTRKCLEEKLKRKAALAEKYYARRQELKKRVRDLNVSPPERFQAQLELGRLPKDSSPIRTYKACSVSGRVKGYSGRGGVSRIVLRELQAQCVLPGCVRDSNH